MNLLNDDHIGVFASLMKCYFVESYHKPRIS